MSNDIEKWFADLEYGRDWQDFDFVLAESALLPRLQNYLADPNGSIEKKLVVISALVELLTDVSQNRRENQNGIVNTIKSTILEHSDIAKTAIPELGLVQSITVQKLLGLPIPPKLPQWVVDAVAKNCI